MEIAGNHFKHLLRFSIYTRCMGSHLQCDQGRLTLIYGEPEIKVF